VEAYVKLAHNGKELNVLHVLIRQHVLYVYLDILWFQDLVLLAVILVLLVVDQQLPALNV